MVGLISSAAPLELRRIPSNKLLLKVSKNI
jgi:hypothetical protein